MSVGADWREEGVTREEILAMEPGRELDVSVAVNVMGWQRWESKGIDKVWPVIVPPMGDERHNWAAEWDEHGCPHWMPHYSTDISAAWEVVEKMQNTPCRDGDHFCARVEGFKNAHEAAFFHHLVGIPGDDGLEYYEARGITAPEAICKAALLAVIEEESQCTPTAQ